MNKKQQNLGYLLLRYWFVIVVALIGFGIISGFLPQCFKKMAVNLPRKETNRSVTDSLNSVEQGEERREIMKY